MDRVRLTSPGWGFDRMTNLIIAGKIGGIVKNFSKEISRRHNDSLNLVSRKHGQSI